MTELVPKNITPPAGKPQRVQLSRRAGWRMPPNTVKVDRTTKWGNPFVVGKPCAYSGGRPIQDNRHAWSIYRAVAPENEKLVIDARAELRGKNLACWRPPSAQCHADVLLELANS
jgi:hypothetical protein